MYYLFKPNLALKYCKMRAYLNNWLRVRLVLFRTHHIIPVIDVLKIALVSFGSKVLRFPMARVEPSTWTVYLFSVLFFRLCFLLFQLSVPYDST